MSAATDPRTVFVTGGSGYLGGVLIPMLRAKGYSVTAMSRSESSDERLTRLGATPVRCDLDDVAALTSAIRGNDAVIHAAARFREGGGDAAYVRDNVEGTRHLLAAARAAGARRFVFVGAAGSLIGGRRPIVDADESWPLNEPSYSPYFRTKAIADREVLAANSDDFTTCAVRPGLIWGGDGDTFVERIAAATRNGKMRFIGGGRHRLVTSHVENSAHAIFLALERGRGGEAYFAFDDGVTETRTFFGQLLATRGLAAPDRSIPFLVAWLAATILETAWKVLRRPGSPPISRELVALSGGPFVVSDARARANLGYVPVISREAALARLTVVNNASA